MKASSTSRLDFNADLKGEGQKKGYTMAKKPCVGDLHIDVGKRV